MKKNNDRFVIFGLVALYAALAFVMFMLGQNPKGEGIPDDSAGIIHDVMPGSIEDFVRFSKPIILPDTAHTPERPNPELTGSDIPLTTINGKPGPPEKPDTAHDHNEGNTQGPPTDPKLTDPDQKPDANPKPAETQTPKETAPNPGEKNNNSEIYIPGFGWVKDEGGGGRGERSGSDGDWNKIIGH
jgi:hypothetical protein